MITVIIMLIGGTGFGLGLGIIIGYWLGKRSRASEQRAGFPVAPTQDARHAR